MRFELKNLAFLLFVWAIMNILNGVLIFTHDTIGGSFGSLYYPTQGVIRLLIGVDSMILFLYIYLTADDIVIFTRNNSEDK